MADNALSTGTSASSYDTVIIGAGVIGAALGFELSRRGWRTLNVDRLPAAGYGSTSNSGAIVRFTYSTRHGVSMAYEGVQYWLDWPDYLETDDELGLAVFHQCGMASLKAPGGHYQKVVPHFDAVGVKYEEWDLAELLARLPVLDPGAFGPPTRPEDDAFWAEASGTLEGAIFCPEAGYVSDPALAAHNLQRAAEAKGGTFRFNTEVTAIDRGHGRVRGVSLADGTSVSAPVVVNVTGPHSHVVNKMAGVYDSMHIKTRSLRHELHHAPAPPDFDFEHDGFNVADADTGIYFRPDTGNNVLLGSTDPDCDPREFVDPDDFNREITASQWEAQLLRYAKRVPSAGMPHERRGVVDLFDVSDDWLPIYDRTDLDGFYVAIGTSGNQFKNAGVAAHCLAELIDAVERHGHDHDAQPMVVPGRYTGTPIELGRFSRNREVSSESSMSVRG